MRPLVDWIVVLLGCLIWWFVVVQIVWGWTS